MKACRCNDIGHKVIRSLSADANCFQSNAVKNSDVFVSLWEDLNVFLKKLCCKYITSYVGRPLLYELHNVMLHTKCLNQWSATTTSSNILNGHFIPECVNAYLGTGCVRILSAWILKLLSCGIHDFREHYNLSNVTSSQPWSMTADCITYDFSSVSFCTFK